MDLNHEDRMKEISESYENLIFLVYIDKQTDIIYLRCFVHFLIFVLLFKTLYFFKKWQKRENIFGISNKCNEKKISKNI